MAMQRDREAAMANASGLLLDNPFFGKKQGLKTLSGAEKASPRRSKFLCMSGKSRISRSHGVPATGVPPSALAIRHEMHASDASSFSEASDEYSKFRGLVLDTSYRPINIVCWKKALVLQILEKADVLQYYDQEIQSPNRSWQLPAVLRVSGFVHNPKEKSRRLSVSRNNIMLRDNFTCQYCGVVGTSQDLTIDHVVPLSKRGGATWDNLVTACAPCNCKKGHKSPQEAGMKLLKKPKEPKELLSRDSPPNYRIYRCMKRNPSTPAEWLDWLPTFKRNDVFSEL